MLQIFVALSVCIGCGSDCISKCVRAAVESCFRGVLLFLVGWFSVVFLLSNYVD